MILMLSETGLQADNTDTSNKRTFLFVQPRPPDGKCHKTNSHEDSKKRKNTFSCTQNVQPMFVTEKTSLYTAKHTQPRSFIPIQLKALKC